MTVFNSKYIYRCADCGKEYDGLQTLYLCPDCSAKNETGKPPPGVLQIVYNYQKLKKSVSSIVNFKARGFIDVMPFEKISSLPMLRVGNTPLYNFNNLNGEKLPFEICFKDDSQNPTFSFKDRASAVVSAYAKEKGYETIVTASTGNAGSSLAGLCAAQGQKAIIMVPETAPIAKLTQIIMYGATIIPVKGTYDDAFDLSIKATEEFGWYNRNTAFNPLTIEGKKTVSFELYEQLGYSLPDRIFVPVGDGVIISGVYKGFEDLLKLEIIDKMPEIVMVQSENSDNIVRNMESEEFISKPSTTIADSISVDIPRNFYMVKHYIKKYEGKYLTVSDSEIIEASRVLSKNTGIFSEPAAATAFAGLLAYSKRKKINDNSRNVVLLTGSGLKDLKSINRLLNIPVSIRPEVGELKKILKL
ncbi:MAG TPA: threonine synthase [Bacteroidales bacterium]|nr:threonine synthase [Bacteroidales bacterium]